MEFELTNIDSFRINDCEWNVDSIKEIKVIDDFVPSTIEEDAVKCLNNLSYNEFVFETNNLYVNYDLINKMFNPHPNSYTIAYTEYVQARKHKKRRINKKWLKRYGLKPIQVESDGWEIHDTHEDGSFELVKSMGDE
jgi:hypothetical protein